MSISSVTLSGIQRVINSRPMKYMAKQYEKDNRAFMTGVAVTSIILKDALGCVMYVYQSLNNKKIPEEKRGFVAALDLANGGLMIGTQILATVTIGQKKVQEKIFDALFGKSINRSFRKGVLSKLFGKYGEQLSEKMLNKNYLTAKKSAVGAFAMFTTLVASTIVAKRMIVPFIATPLATYIKENHMPGGKSDKNKNQNVQAVDTNRQYLSKKFGQYGMDNFTQSK